MPVRIQADFRLPDLGYPPIQVAHRQFSERADEVAYRSPATAGDGRHLAVQAAT
jgi:hypothetical protein